MTPEYKLDAARDPGRKNANKQLHRGSRIVMAFANLSGPSRQRLMNEADFSLKNAKQEKLGVKFTSSDRRERFL